MKLVFALCAAVLAIAGLAWIWDTYIGVVRERYDRKRFPAIRGSSKLAADLQREAALRHYNAALVEFRSVRAKLDAAEARGADVAQLKARLPNVWRLIKKGEYRYAKMILNAIRLGIPGEKTREEIRPLSDADFTGEDNENVGASPRGEDAGPQTSRSKNRRP